ncbi:MAG: T9SS type A sorting domain-containing protein, partial [Ginsengibacter sp.]
YKNDSGWYNPRSWLQINTPSGQTPIQRVPTAEDDVVISHSMSGIASVGISTDDDSPPNTDFNVGADGPGSASRCRSLHISNTQISFDNSSLFAVDDAPTVNIFTSNGGFVIIDSGSNVLHGHFALHGGNPAVTDLQILNSIYGVLFSHGNWTGMDWDTGARLKFVGSQLAGFHFSGHGSANVFIDSSHIETNNFIIGDSSTATLTNSMITNNGNNVYLTFFIGKNSNFVSARDTIFTYSDLSFTTSGSQFNGDVKGDGQGPGMFEFLQEDTAHPLPNIINGSLSTNELATGISLSGDLKISGDLSGFADDAINNQIAVLVDSQDVFHVGGIENFGSSPFINNCTNGFCHFNLEFFGSTNSNIEWNGGFPADTLIINKTGCAKVTCDSSLYVAGETRIKSGQLSLLPNEYPYKLVCAGNVDIAQGGGLFLRKDAAGVVANMAIKGTLVDHNTTSDTSCAGLSNPYNGWITFYTDSTTRENTDSVAVLHTDSLINFSGHYFNKSVILNWTIENQVNAAYFVIEKSFDQLSFTALTNIAAAGNQQDNTDYQYTDSTSLKEYNYYRVKIVRTDSSYSYSNLISIAAPTVGKIVFFPNPVKDKLHIRMPVEAGETEIIIADAKGAVINHMKLDAGTTEVYLNTASLQPGIYYISFHSGKFKNTKQFVKE